MTAPTYGPSRAAGTGIREITELHQRIEDLERKVDQALRLLIRATEKRLDEELAKWGDVPERVARIEDLLNPMTVDPADPDVEWSYRRGDGILVPAPADPDERLKMIAAGMKLFPVVRRPREDGRMDVTPPPKLVARAAGILIDRAEAMP